MGFGNPLALWWLLLALPIVACYLLRQQGRRVEVSTLTFWTEVVDERLPRRIWRRLRHPISLLCQLLMLILFVLAVSDPYWGSRREPYRTIVVIDTSASMGTRRDGSTRLDKALDRIRTLLTDAVAGDETAVIATAPSPQIVCGLTDRSSAVKAAIAELSVSDAPGQLQEAITIAQRLAADQPESRILVMSDTVPAERDSTSAVKHEVIGRPAENLAITQLQVRRSHIDPQTFFLLVGVRSFSDTDEAFTLDVSFKNRILKVISDQLSPNEQWSRSFEFTEASGGEISARLTPEDGLPIDNVAYALLPPCPPVRVVFVNPSQEYLEKAFAAIPQVTVATVETVPKSLGPNDVLVLDGRVPDEIPEGSVLVVQPQNDCPFWTVGREIENPVLSPEIVESPLTLHVRPGGLAVNACREITLDAGSRMLIRTADDHPVLWITDRPSGPIIGWNTSLDDGELPFRTAFPILARNVLSWLTPGGAQWVESVPTGFVGQIDIPRALAGTPSRLVISSPRGDETTVVPREGHLFVGPIDQVGIWWITDPEHSDHTTPLLAANLANAVESNIRGADSSRRWSRAASGPWRASPWFVLLVLVGIASIVEWFLYHRRWVV